MASEEWLDPKIPYTGPAPGSPAWRREREATWPEDLLDDDEAPPVGSLTKGWPKGSRGTSETSETS